jgi:uncharacterized membrane protein
MALTVIGAALAGLAIRRAGLIGLAASAASAFLVARALRDARRGGSSAIAMSHSITIDRPRKTLYRFWRDFTNLPEIIDGLQRVDVLDPRRSRWVMDAPLGQTVEWDVEITEDRPNERIAWAASDRGLANGGWVEFRDTGTRRGTEVRALLVVELPSRLVGPTIAAVFRRDPGELVRDALWALKKRFEDETADSPER